MLDADVSGAPVVDDAGRLVGVLTEKDLIWKVGAGGRDLLLYDIGNLFADVTK